MAHSPRWWLLAPEQGQDMERGSGIEQTGLLEGLNMGSTGKGGSKNDNRVCGLQSPRWCHLWQDWARSRCEKMELGIVCCPMPRLGTEKTPVYANSHIGLVCELGGICSVFPLALHSLCPRSSLFFPHVLLTPPSLFRQL